jgi:hypothetical protein
VPWTGIGPTTRRPGVPRPAVTVAISEVEGLGDTASGNRAERRT